MRKLTTAVLGFAFSGLAIAQSSQYFTIKIVDDQTGRGVPLVELRTTNDTSYFTDSNGIVAFYEPGLMERSVYFNIRSDGYESPKDFLGNRGAALQVTSGGSAVLKIRRTSIAERLYRITGQGIYRDSVLVGAPVPLKQPVLNGQVMGQDGGLAIPYRGKIFWIWGDTAQPAYPLGNFGCSGATSEWPSSGGLDPNAGVDLSYFVDDSGLSRPMFPSASFPGPGPKWTGGLKIVRDELGKERLVADYVRIKNLGEAYERGEAIYDDKTETFQRLRQFDLYDSMSSACWGGHPARISVSGVEYYYQGYTPPFLCRVKADLAHAEDPHSFESFSPLAPGTRYDKAATRLDRDPGGRLRYAWKRDTPPLTPRDEHELIAAKKMSASEGFLQLRSVDTDKPVAAGPGSVEWNAYRKRWIMIVKEDEGLTNHGTIWFAEADTPLGPWVYAKRILRHEYYNFYNPVHHAFFDKDGGRLIFFEGTYSDFFAAAGPLTPRYNYNQIMYRLDLADSRLELPVPVYLVRRGRLPDRYLLRDELDAQNAWDDIEAVPFFAMPSHYKDDGLIPIFASASKHGPVLRPQPSLQAAAATPLFYALPVAKVAPPHPQGPSGSWSCNAKLADGSDYAELTLDLSVDGDTVRATNTGDAQGTFRDGELRLVIKTDKESYALAGELKEDKLNGTWQNRTDAAEHGTWHCVRPPVEPAIASPAVVSLYEYVNVRDGSYLYSTNPSFSDRAWQRSAQPLCRVWRNPLSQLFLDPTAKPFPGHAGKFATLQ